MVARAGTTAAPLASLAALGVVFGGIGTSPLYALSTSLNSPTIRWTRWLSTVRRRW